MDYLLDLILSSYVLGILFMFLPEKWFPKRYNKSVEANEKKVPIFDAWKKQFLIIGFTVIATLIFVKYVIL